MPIEYRDDHDIDLDALAALFASVGWHHRVADRARLRQMLEGSRYVAWARDGPRLVGFARAISDGAFNAYVSTVAVSRDHQRRGIGSALVRRLLDGKDGLTFALHARKELHRFYAACGFEVSPEMLRRQRRA